MLCFCSRVGARYISKTAYCNFSSKLKIPSLLPSIPCSSVSLHHFTFLPQVILCCLQDYCSKILSPLMASPHIYIGLHCTSCLCKEPTAFCWVLTFPWWDINTRSYSMWTLDGRDWTIIALQHTHTKQTCSISITPCSLWLFLTHTNTIRQTTTGQTGSRLWNLWGLSGWWDTFSISGLALIRTNLPSQKDKRQAISKRGAKVTGGCRKRKPGAWVCLISQIQRRESKKISRSETRGGPDTVTWALVFVTRSYNKHVNVSGDL